jgi:methylated-DNA-protein-cysteine methyltransferase related protein
VKKDIFTKIYKLVEKIPKGKVTTYGSLARALGISDSRVVGWALHGNKNLKTPCHRVVDRQGKLASVYVFGGWQKQKEKLTKERVVFSDEKTVDLKTSGYEFG